MEFFLTIFINVGFFLIGYLIGSINTSIVFSKIFNKPDLREYYSKNAGATNSLRVYGTKSAVFILLIDIFKTFTMVLICLNILWDKFSNHPRIYWKNKRC
ncbi:glycerol-3-phosphate acyltransferase [Mycoplasmopsis cynos]|nr:glycerol-3-phosphate acyltransferase [Mycoplasmopsis cynos]